MYRLLWFIFFTDLGQILRFKQMYIWWQNLIFILFLMTYLDVVIFIIKLCQHVFSPASYVDVKYIFPCPFIYPCLKIVQARWCCTTRITLPLPVRVKKTSFSLFLTQTYEKVFNLRNRMGPALHENPDQEYLQRFQIFKAYSLGYKFTLPFVFFDTFNRCIYAQFQFPDF